MSEYEPECNSFDTCLKGVDSTCKGCNVWNLRHDFGALYDWCEHMHEDIRNVEISLRHKLTRRIKEKDL